MTSARLVVVPAISTGRTPEQTRSWMTSTRSAAASSREFSTTVMRPTSRDDGRRTGRGGSPYHGTGPCTSGPLRLPRWAESSAIPQQKGTALNSHDYTPTDAELQEIERANDSGKQPVVFVHGLWLLDSSWDRWAAFFEDAGYVAVTPGWPNDPDDVAAARADPTVFAGNSVGDVAAYQQMIIETARPQTGHHRPFLRWRAGPDPRGPRAGRRDLCHLTGAVPRRAAAADRRPQSVLRGVVQPGEPASRHHPHLRPVPVRLRQRRLRRRRPRAVRPVPCRRLGDPAVPGGLRQHQPRHRGQGRQDQPGPWTDVDHRGRRGPSGTPRHRRSHGEAAAQEQGLGHRVRRDPRPGHSLTIDAGWQEVAQTCLAFISRFVN